MIYPPCRLAQDESTGDRNERARRLSSRARAALLALHVPGLLWLVDVRMVFARITAHTTAPEGHDAGSTRGGTRGSGVIPSPRPPRRTARYGHARAVTGPSRAQGLPACIPAHTSCS